MSTKPTDTAQTFDEWWGEFGLSPYDYEETGRLKRMAERAWNAAVVSRMPVDLGAIKPTWPRGDYRATEPQSHVRCLCGTVLMPDGETHSPTGCTSNRASSRPISDYTGAY